MSNPRFWSAGLLAALLAITFSNAKSAATESTSTGSAWLGISAERIDNGWRERENYWSNGVLVARVAPGSPADHLGVQAGDVIVSVGSRLLEAPGDLATTESALEPGQPVSMVVARNGGRLIRILNIEPVENPALEKATVQQDSEAEAAPEIATPSIGTPVEDSEEREISGKAPTEETAVDEASADETSADETSADEAPVPPVSGSPRSDAFGARCAPLNIGLANALGVPVGHGVLVLELVGGGAAEKAGLRAGDVITRVGEIEIGDPERLTYALETGPRLLPIESFRGGTARHMRVPLAMRPVAKKASPPAKAADPPPALEAPETEETPTAGIAPPVPDDDAPPATIAPDPPVGTPEAKTPEAPPEAASPDPVAEAPPEVVAPDRELTPPPTLAPDDGANRVNDDGLSELRDQLRRLRAEIRRMRAEIDELKKF